MMSSFNPLLCAEFYRAFNFLELPPDPSPSDVWEAEESVGAALSALRKCGAHLLATTLKIELSPGEGYIDTLDEHTHWVPVVIVAPLSVNMATVQYQSVRDEVPVPKLEPLDNDDIPF